MPLINYEARAWTPSAASQKIIDDSIAICSAYLAQGYDLTVRQLFYQHVARGLLANTFANYKRVVRIALDARDHGLMDWNYLTDRTRNLAALPHWKTPADIIDAAAASYRLDKWRDADHLVEVWVEKEALSGLVQQACNDVDIAWLACRGYVSGSEIWQGGQRISRYIRAGKRVTVLHLGDHDPSGLDMSRDIETRLRKYVSYHTGDRSDRLTINRIALTPAQIAQYNPPPQFAKQTDSRYQAYVAATGLTQSWELDALDPPTLIALITSEVEKLRDQDVWDNAVAQENDHKALLQQVVDNWDDIADQYGSNGNGSS